MTKPIRIAGPPGTGKTKRLVEIFYDCIQKYSATQIIITSHTKVAAKEVFKRILDDANIQEYQDRTGVDIFRLVKESKKTLEENVTTIHKYCKSQIEKKKGKAIVFDIEDYNNLKLQYPLFDDHTGSKEFYKFEMLIAGHPFFKFHNSARDNGKDTVKYYRSLTFPERAEYKYNITELQELEKNYNNFKTNKKKNQRSEIVLDFQDMVEHFTDSDEIKSEDLGIKILIVDEAQDSSVLQRAAEKKMAAAVEYFYKAGDPDQSIFEFAGANPDSFHKEFANPEEELKQGYRCPRVINEYCKDIIRPLWKHYKYAGGGRVWSPRRELGKEGKPTGPVVEGEKFEMMNLEQDPYLEDLDKRLTQTNETAAFTYRGNEPKDMIRYLIKLGMPFKIVDAKDKFKFKYPTADIKNQRNFSKLIRGNEKLSAAATKGILKNTLPEYVGKHYSEENLDEIDKGNYDIEWLIKRQFLNPIVKKSDDFQNIKKINKISYISTIEMKNFIRRVVEYDPSGDLEKTPRIFLENIHTIKGKEFDNCVVDLTIQREEHDYTKRRIKYVACSRARKTLWLIKSKNGMTL